MQSSLQPQPIAKDLVLVGGGHSHAIALKQLGMKPIPGVRLTLITDVSHTPYSGMLPGYVAGLYRFDDCHIDLRPLSRFAQAQMVVDRAIGLDLQKNRVLLANHPPIAFDILSIDIGSTPATLTVPGAADRVIPVKPISQFLRYWDQCVSEVQQAPERFMRLAIVGGGAGGVELALAIQARLQTIYATAQQPSTNLEVHLFQRGSRLLPERNAWVGNKLEHILKERGIHLHLRETVCAIEDAAIEDGVMQDSAIENRAISAIQNTAIQNTALKTSVPSAHQIRCESGLTVTCDRIFWVTQASAASWLAASGLKTDDRGFVLVNDALQSISHPQVFAAGDVATLRNHVRPKAGVFAVRQGKPLVQNLRRALQRQPLLPFVPQKEFLILVGTGDRSAIASRGVFGVGAHPLLWRWKDYIDRQFMAKFCDLQPMGETKKQGQPNPLPHSQSQALETPLAAAPSPMRCAGCGSKVGSSILERVLNQIRQEQPFSQRDDILIGLDTPDDAAVVTVPAGQVMVQTIDYFRALMDDPFLFGQIAANHCLSDLFAMGATPQSGLAIATLPYALEAKLEETLYQLLSGAVKVLHQEQATLIGGHTTEGSELAFGLTCNGLASPDQLWRKSGMLPGQVLILTKPLGTGTLFAADMQLRAKGRWIEGAIASMLVSNRTAADCLRQHQATACTDVTGFGLLGHLIEMVQASQVAVELELDAISLLEGAQETMQQGFLSSLHPQNSQVARHLNEANLVAQNPLYPILFDPQTAGGLLASVPAEAAHACLEQLKAIGYPQSCIVGRVLPPTAALPITCR